MRDSKACVALPTSALACVLGDPITHSLSPRLHEAALRHVGIDGHYLAFQTGPTKLAQTLRALAALGFRGANLTSPLKVEALGVLDEVDADVGRIGAVNTVVFGPEAAIGHNTDSQGLRDALTEFVGYDPRGGRVVILGTGGAARAAAVAMVDAGVSEISVLSRSLERAQSMAVSLGGPVSGIDRIDGRAVELIINATTVGMSGGGAEGGVPIELDLLREVELVYDLVYAPTTTPLIAAARQRGIAAYDGRSMLAGQARIAFGHFFGLQPSLEVFLAPLGL